MFGKVTALDTEHAPDPTSSVEFLTVEEVAARFRVSQVAIRRMVRAGRIPCVRVGRLIRIPRTVADEMAVVHRESESSGVENV